MSDGSSFSDLERSYPNLYHYAHGAEISPLPELALSALRNFGELAARQLASALDIDLEEERQRLETVRDNKKKIDRLSHQEVLNVVLPRLERRERDALALLQYDGNLGSHGHDDIHKPHKQAELEEKKKQAFEAAQSVSRTILKYCGSAQTNRNSDFGISNDNNYTNVSAGIDNRIRPRRLHDLQVKPLAQATAEPNHRYRTQSGSAYEKRVSKAGRRKKWAVLAKPISGLAGFLALSFCGYLVSPKSPASQAPSQFQQAPPSVVAPRITSLLTGTDLSNSGTLDEIFDVGIPGPASIAAKAWFENASVGDSQLRFELLGATQQFACNPILAAVRNGQFWCKWPDIPIGSYHLYAYVGTASSIKSFNVFGRKMKAKVAAPLPPPIDIGKPQGASVNAGRDDASVPNTSLEQRPSPPSGPTLRLLRVLQLWIVPYIPQHVIFDDADQLVVRSRNGIAILLDGRPISGCYDPDFTTAQHGMYTFESCGDTRTTIEVTKYVLR